MSDVEEYKTWTGVQTQRRWGCVE